MLSTSPLKQYSFGQSAAQEQDFERELKRIYFEIDKFSNNYWSIKDEYELINPLAGKKRTRSKISDEVLADSKEWQRKTDAQFGYGEITKGAMSNLLTTFQAMSSLDEIKQVKSAGTFYDMAAGSGSTFLDIGAGFGKPVFHAAIQTSCESYGVEIVPARVYFCEDQKYNWIDQYSRKQSRHDSPTVPVSSSKQNGRSAIATTRHSEVKASEAKKRLEKLEKMTSQLAEVLDQACTQQELPKKHLTNVRAMHADIENKLAVMNQPALPSSQENNVTPYKHIVAYKAKEWVQKCHFSLVDAAREMKSYVDCTGRDITHIYSYNKVMSTKDAHGICEILNRTQFRVLAWYMSPDNSRKAGLKDVRFVTSMSMQSTGSEKFSVFIYIKEQKAIKRNGASMLKKAKSQQAPTKNGKLV